MVTSVLLTAGDEATSALLSGRIQGSDLQEHVERSRVAASELETFTPAWVHRVGTDKRNEQDIASELIAITGWDSAPYARA